MSHTKLIGIRVQHEDPVALAVIVDMLQDELQIVFEAWIFAMKDPKPVIEFVPLPEDTSPTTLKAN
jgi:hypothetical protein